MVLLAICAAIIAVAFAAAAVAWAAVMLALIDRLPPSSRKEMTVLSRRLERRGSAPL